MGQRRRRQSIVRASVDGVWRTGTTLGERRMEKESKKSGRGGKRPGAGRPKGSLDKGNAALREMILAALDGVGGQEYLQRQAEQKPVAFLALIGKVLPTTLEGNVSGSITVNIKHF